MKDKDSHCNQVARWIKGLEIGYVVFDQPIDLNIRSFGTIISSLHSFSLTVKYLIYFTFKEMYSKDFLPTFIAPMRHCCTK